MAEKKRNIVGFKKFSDMKNKPKVEEVDLALTPDGDSDLPANPNSTYDSNKLEKPASTKSIKPEIEEEFDIPTDAEKLSDEKKKVGIQTDKTEESVKTFGKIAKFPKNVKASKAYNFLENVKISKKSIWYIIIEHQDSELQLVKYNYKEGVDLYKFVNELKNYYINKNQDNKELCEAVKKLKVDGNDKYSIINNISKIKIDDKLLITKITEDLISLLSK